MLRLSVLRRVALLCSVSILAISCATGSQAGQLTAAAFQTYDPSAAASIVPGPFALFTVQVGSIHPTQLNEGYFEVGKKTAGFNLLAPSQLQGNLLTAIEPVVIGPGGQLYITDGHHTFTALENSIYGASNPTVYVNVIANYSNLTMSQFYQTMQSQNLLLPLNNGVPQTVNPATGAPIPTSLTALTNDAYRGLEYGILKNKSSKLFTTTGNITGAVGSSTPGLDKMTGFYSDFLEAAAYRKANGGLGLPYLSPIDIAIATNWNLNAASVTTLPNVSGTVTAAQLPGFIPASSITLNGVISNSTLASGALDGNGTFTGITTINAGTVAAPIVIGTPNTGFIMQLGNDKGATVTLGGANTYTGGTSILAGDLIVAGDSSLGAAVPGGATIDLNNIKTSVQAANGIVFNSLSEGNGTLTLGTVSGNGTATFSTARPIAVDGETATININGYLVSLTGQLVSLGSNGVGIGNATGVSDLTIDDNSSNKGILTLSTASPNFYGNIIIGNNNAPTVRVMNDAALGNTTGVAASIGQVDLNGGTLQAGASFAAPERNLFLGGGSSFDVNGFSTSWGTLTDVQRTLKVLNSNTTTTGAVTFNSLVVGGTATLQLAGGAAGETVTLTNGITRQPGATLVILPTNSTSLGTATEKLFSAGQANTNGIVAPWIVTNNGVSNSGGPYDFVTNGANGLVKASYGATSVGAGTGSTVVDETGNQTLAASAAAYALKIESGKTITLGSNTLTLGDGTNPAGLILGATTPISGGTLAFGGSEGVIWLGSGGTSTINSTITGTGGLTIAGKDGLTLTGSSTLTGPITIDSGTLTLGAINYFATNPNITLADTKSKPAAATFAITANNTVASLNSVGNNSAVNISNGATLTIGDGQNLDSTLSATVTQTGTAATALVKAGGGLLDLSGGKVKLVANGGIAVTGGELRVAASIFTGTSPTTNTFALSSGTELQFAQNGGGQFAGAVTGAGALHLIGGTLQLTGTANTYSGGTFVEAGSTLDLTTANVSSGNANITNAGGLIVFDQATSGIYSGVISDGRQMRTTSGAMLSGSLVKDDSTGASGGNVTLGAVQTYTGGTYVEAGTLTLGVANAIATSADVDLGRVGGPLGNGAAPGGGPATAILTLGADNTLQGLTNEAGNNTAVQLNGFGLTVNTATGSAWSFGGAITGTGTLTKSGSGLFSLTGTNSYVGPTTVNAGTLNVDGSIVSSVVVNSGGALSGSGSVGATQVNSGGIFAPGPLSAPGAISITGNLAFQAGASYVVQVNPSSASVANVTGTASLAGTVLPLFAAGSYLSKSYTILTSSGLNGTKFDGVAGNLSSGLTTSLSYTPTNVILNLSATLGAGGGLGTTQQNVANTLNSYFNNGGSLPPGFVTLFGLSGANLSNGLAQVSGQPGASAAQAGGVATGQFTNAIFDNAFDGGGSGAGGAVGFAEENAYAAKPKASREAAEAYAAVTPRDRLTPLGAARWTVWASAYGGNSRVSGDAASGTNTTTSRAYGAVAGASYRVTPDWQLGFALGGAGTSFSLEGGLGGGKADMFNAALYTKRIWGPAYIAAALTYAWQDVTTDRTVTVAGTDTLHAAFKANALAERVEGGWRFATPAIGIAPYAALQATTFYLPGYGETATSGSNQFALSYASHSVTATRGELGARFDKAILVRDGVFTLKAKTAWAHDWNTDRTATATFQSLPGASFTTSGAQPSANAALVSLGAEMGWRNGWSVAASADGEFSSTTRGYTGKGVLRYVW